MYSWERARLGIWRNIILAAVAGTLVIEFSRVSMLASVLAVLFCTLLALWYWLTFPMPVAIIQATVRAGGEQPQLYIVGSCSVGAPALRWFPFLPERRASVLPDERVISFTAELAQPSWNVLAEGETIILVEVLRRWPRERTWRWSPAGTREPAVTLRQRIDQPTS